MKIPEVEINSLFIPTTKIQVKTEEIDCDSFYLIFGEDDINWYIKIKIDRSLYEDEKCQTYIRRNKC